MASLRKRVSGHPVLWATLVAMLIAAAAFAAGYIVADDAGKVGALESELAKVEDGREQARSERADVLISEGETAEELQTVEEELAAERSLNGMGETQQKAPGEYETDFDWNSAGTVGYLTMKPVAFEKQGEKWTLTIEAKNEGKEPEEPFCGSAGGTLIDAEDRNYSGEAVLGEGSDNCGEALQPGLTGTYKSEFKVPPGATPVGVALYGDYEQEEEAKTWELPH
jgi:hypothetical protein